VGRSDSVNGGKLLQLVIVRRDEVATFELLCRVFADDPDVRVVWDRRVGERRKGPAPPGVERRLADRRRPSKPWTNLNYVVSRASA
jgi:hypothetical protein